MKNYARIISVAALSLCCTFAGAQSVRDLLKVRNGTVTSKWENNDKQEYFLNLYNTDFCEYYVTRGDDFSYVANPGKTQVYRFDNYEAASNYTRYSQGYRYSKGRPLKSFDPKFPYALPVSSGTVVKALPDKRQPVRSYVFLIEPGDPVFAMRSGKVCICEVPGCLLVYHKDGSFAAYIGLDDIGPVEGDGVLTGEQIGLCSKARLCVSLFFLDANKYDGKSYPYTHFTPVVRTSGGDIKLDTKEPMTAVVDADIISLDMGKTARKKYLKKHAGK